MTDASLFFLLGFIGGMSFVVVFELVSWLRAWLEWRLEPLASRFIAWADRSYPRD